MRTSVLRCRASNSAELSGKTSGAAIAAKGAGTELGAAA